jgi:hypothetical protein
MCSCAPFFSFRVVILNAHYQSDLRRLVFSRDKQLSGTGAFHKQAFHDVNFSLESP